AQKPHHRPVKGPVKKAVKAHHRASMKQAYKFFKRTNIALFAAQKALKKNHVYTGDFGKAVAHQRLAKKYLNAHKPNKAIYHSKRARELAKKVIAANKGNWPENYDFDNEEMTFIKDAPSDAELDKEIGKVNTNDKDYENEDLSELEVLEMSPADYKTSDQK
ncbi:MAG TPA: hypothetical protein DIU39_01110, partial [Flavobacteriales bacterium]|nr:hypothetical protein [Flavobacteriales bacterium]